MSGYRPVRACGEDGVSCIGHGGERGQRRSRVVQQFGGAGGPGTDGLRFDRGGARRLWEAVSGSQPVGREEGESRGFRGWKPLACLLVSQGVAEAQGRGHGPAPRSTVPHPWRSARPFARAPGDSLTRAPRYGPGAVGQLPEKIRLRHPEIARRWSMALSRSGRGLLSPRLSHLPRLTSS